MGTPFLLWPTAILGRRPSCQSWGKVEILQSREHKVLELLLGTGEAAECPQAQDLRNYPSTMQEPIKEGSPEEAALRLHFEGAVGETAEKGGSR